MEHANIQVLIMDGALKREDPVADTLVAAGFATRMFGDSVSAIGALEVWRPAVIVVDLRSPSSEARQFCTLLRERSETMTPPVVLVAEGSNLLKRIAVTPSGLVAVPVDGDQLASTVLRVARHAVAVREGAVSSR